MKPFEAYNSDNIPAVMVDPEPDRKTPLPSRSAQKVKRMDPLTARLRQAGVDSHMNWVEQLITTVHKGECSRAFQEAIDFVCSVHGDNQGRSRLNKIAVL